MNTFVEAMEICALLVCATTMVSSPAGKVMLLFSVLALLAFVGALAHVGGLR